MSGRLYIGAGVAVYKVSERTGDATSIAPGFTWGQAFARPCGVAVDGAGNVLVADGDEVVAVAARTGTFYGRKMVTGRVYPLATVEASAATGRRTRSLTRPATW